MQTLYTAISTVKGGRAGHVRSSDGIIDMDLRMPKSMGGTGEKGTNPEQLFASGYAACYESALRHVAQQQKRNIKDLSITAYVSINMDEKKGYFLSVELHGNFAEMSKDEARSLMEAANEVCPYSKALHSNVDVKLVVD